MDRTWFTRRHGARHERDGRGGEQSAAHAKDGRGRHDDRHTRIHHHVCDDVNRHAAVTAFAFLFGYVFEAKAGSLPVAGLPVVSAWYLPSAARNRPT
jgi:hypothetical protein